MAAAWQAVTASSRTRRRCVIVFAEDPKSDQVYSDSVAGLGAYTLEFDFVGDGNIDPATLQIGFDGAEAACGHEGVGYHSVVRCPVPDDAKVVRVRRIATGQPMPRVTLFVEATQPCRMKESQVCAM